MRIFILSFFFLVHFLSHKLNLFVYDEDSKVIASAYFASGSYCNECKVTVFDDKNNLIEEGLTNKEGEYIVKNPKAKLLIKVEALGGHAAQSEFEVKNLKHEKEKIQSHNLLEGLFAAFLLALIF